MSTVNKFKQYMHSESGMWLPDMVNLELLIFDRAPSSSQVILTDPECLLPCGLIHGSHCGLKSHSHLSLSQTGDRGTMSPGHQVTGGVSSSYIRYSL